MSGILKVISVVSSLIGISNFIEKEIPEKKGTHDSVVRVAVALNDVNVGFNDADGMSPMILAFNELGDNCGVSKYARRELITSGSWRDIIVHQRGQTPAIPVAAITPWPSPDARLFELNSRRKGNSADFVDQHRSCSWPATYHTADHGKRRRSLHSLHLTNMGTTPILIPFAYFGATRCPHVPIAICPCDISPFFQLGP